MDSSSTPDPKKKRKEKNRIWFISIQPYDKTPIVSDGPDNLSQAYTALHKEMPNDTWNFQDSCLTLH